MQYRVTRHKYYGDEAETVSHHIAVLPELTNDNWMGARMSIEDMGPGESLKLSIDADDALADPPKIFATIECLGIDDRPTNRERLIDSAVPFGGNGLRGKNGN